MTSSELSEWIAFSGIEPFGDSRADLRAGIVAAAAVNSGFARPKEPARATDFMPFLDIDRKAANDAILLKDPVEHGKLVAQILFSGLPVADKRSKG